MSTTGLFVARSASSAWPIRRKTSSGATDFDPDEELRHASPGNYDDEASIRASGLEGLDLFE